MLIWRGHGYWVLLLPFATLGAVAYVDKTFPAVLVHKQLWFAAALAGAGLLSVLPTNPSRCMQDHARS